MGKLQMALGFSLVVLVTICEQTYAFLPHAKDYTPEVVQPLFDQMRLYGSIEKNKTKKGEKWSQYLVVLIASHNEIMTAQNIDVLFENRFKGRVNLLLNQKDSAAAERRRLDSRHQVHGEVRFIFGESISSKMLNTFNDNHPNENPIVLMYSYYIPCACIPNVNYSCSEELAVCATYNWMNYGLLVAFSETFTRTAASGTTRGTNEEAANQFLTLGGIPTFKYSSNGMDPKNVVDDADNRNRWHSVTFLENFFVCLDRNVDSGCLANGPEDRKAIIAFFVNQIAYDCFRNMNFRWRKKEEDHITGCLIDRIENRIGSDCKRCNGDCAASKKEVSRTCVRDSFNKSLVPGEPEDPSDIFNVAWKITEDKTLDEIFSGAPEDRLIGASRNVSCRDPTFMLQSLCTVSACGPALSRQSSSRASSPPGSSRPSSQGSSRASSPQRSSRPSSQGSNSASSPQVSSRPSSQGRSRASSPQRSSRPSSQGSSRASSPRGSSRPSSQGSSSALSHQGSTPASSLISRITDWIWYYCCECYNRAYNYLIGNQLVATQKPLLRISHERKQQRKIA